MVRQRVPDNDIRLEIRSYMAQHRIDMQQVRLVVCGGIVRMFGEIHHLGGPARPVSVAVLESFERDVVTTRGVRHAHFEFDNWKRDESGLWDTVEERRRAQGTAEEESVPEPAPARRWTLE
jgi:hypothetical protein